MGRRHGPEANTKLAILTRNSGFKQSEVAGICGISPTYYSLMCRGEKAMTATQLIKLAKFFECSVTALLTTPLASSTSSMSDSKTAQLGRSV